MSAETAFSVVRAWIAVVKSSIDTKSQQQPPWYVLKRTHKSCDKFPEIISFSECCGLSIEQEEIFFNAMTKGSIARFMEQKYNADIWCRQNNKIWFIQVKTHDAMTFVGPSKLEGGQPASQVEIMDEPEFQSNIHNSVINLNRLKEWLNRECSIDARTAIRASCHYVDNLALLSAISQGQLDLWKDEAAAAGGVLQDHKMVVLMKYAAQPSTTHHVERGVKFGRQLAKSGRSEKKISQYAMAANNFKQEAIINSLEQQEIDEEDEEQKRQRTGTGRGLPKLQQMSDIVVELANQKAQLLRVDEGATYNSMRNRIRKALHEDEASYLKIRSEQKRTDLLTKVMKNRGTQYAIESIEGWDVTPRVKGMTVFSDLRKNNHIGDLITELLLWVDPNHWNGVSLRTLNFTQLRKLLQDHVVNELKQQNPQLDEEAIKKMSKTFKKRCPDDIFKSAALNDDEE